MSVSGTRVIAATVDKGYSIFDVKSFNNIEKRVGPLKSQIRRIAFAPGGRSFVCGSTEGRVSVEYVDSEENAKLKYAFKCHRVKEAEAEAVYPVNAVVCLLI